MTWAEALKVWSTLEFNVHGRCQRTMMLNILQYFAPPTWMVAIVGLPYIVHIPVNDGMLHRINVFEGDAEICLKFLDWVQVTTTTEISKRNNKKTTKVFSFKNGAMGSEDSEKLNFT